MSYTRTFLCGCAPSRGVICGTHCQWQGCTRDQHTPACVAGERIKDAATAPIGSQIRINGEVATRDDERWMNDHGGSYTDTYLNDALRAGRATVLRVGYGDS